MVVAGTHGNEPGPAVGAIELLGTGYFEGRRDYNWVVVPTLNEYGLLRNMRECEFGDINRAYRDNKNPYAHTVKRLLHKYRPSVVIDFHEGYSWHRKNFMSIGATLTIHEGRGAAKAARMLSALNSTIPSVKEQFSMFAREERPIAGTFSEYCDKHTSAAYILVEIAGQDDIQPLAERVRQTKIVLENV